MIDGIDAAVAAGLAVKINTVALKGVNDGRAPRPRRLVRRPRLRPHLHRGDADGRPRQRGPPRPVLVARATSAAELDARWTLTDTAERTGGPARYARVAETGGRIGFITPLTHNFCESCNRVRLTCTGQLYMCLGQEDDADLRARAARASRTTTRRSSRAIGAAIARKPKGHAFDYSRRTVAGQVARHMSHTGG